MSSRNSRKNCPVCGIVLYGWDKEFNRLHGIFHKKGKEFFDSDPNVYQTNSKKESKKKFSKKPSENSRRKSKGR